MPVADGVYWLRMPLPFDLDHINLWLLDDGDAWTLVDTGASAAVTRDCWERMFADNVLGRPVRRLVVTHFHPDHLGLARWLAMHFGCEVLMSRLTFNQARDLMVPQQQPEAGEILEFCRAHAVSNASEFGSFHTGGLYRQVVDGLPQSWTELGQDDSLKIGNQTWSFDLLGGHAEGHLVLHCAGLNVLISGDQILPTITSNVSKFLDPGPAPDPLGNYLASFCALEHLPADVLVLPSHGRVFRGLHARIDQLRRHHADTLEQVESLCRAPRTAGSLVPDLFPKAGSGLNYMLGFGETLAHVVHLREQGRVDERSGLQGVLYTSHKS
jgi:glyoxylase-like metal-dependent hydrolase (beta-lactamase superfamily II)